MAFMTSSADDNVIWFDGQHPMTYDAPKKSAPVVSQALSMFCDDMRQVTGLTPQASKHAKIKITTRKGDNAIWPGMHSGTPGFFTVKGNKEMADSFGILIGTSHCEPLLRNNVAEWNHSVSGAYNYITNRDQVQQYWIERLQQVKGSEELFTIGMRGIHDGSMEGVKTKKEKLEGLQQVIDDQHELIRKYYDKNVEKMPTKCASDGFTLSLP